MVKKVHEGQVGLVFRAIIIHIRKLPPNWEDQGTKMAHRVTYLVKTYNVIASLVINIRLNKDSPCTSKWGKNMGKESIKKHTCFQG